MNDILTIKNYLLYLKTKCNLSISLHSFNSNLILKKELISFNIHDNPYCIYIKTCNEAHNHCIEKQEKIIQKCKFGAFEGVCWAGVKEYVYPFTCNRKLLGFICVSGYRTQQNEYPISVSRKYNLDKTLLQSTYATLKKELPPKEYVDALVYPLCNMLELAHIKAEQSFEQPNTCIGKIIQYIKQNYTKNITSTTLCKQFHCSRSYLSKVFNTEMKTSITEYITSLRIDTAKSLLAHTKLTIAEIALSVGYNEAYYFSNVFKKHTNTTPSSYRKAQKK